MRLTLTECASQRQKIRNVRYYEAIDRLEKLHTSDEVFCHRKCSSEFTHQKQIKTFEARDEGKRQMLNRQSRNMELHVRIRWLRRRPNTRVEDL